MIKLGIDGAMRSVRASNTCPIAVQRTQGEKVLAVLSAIDNLAKGVAGQAIQNMKIASGLPETEGLWLLPVLP